MSSQTGSLAVDLPAIERMAWYQRRLVDQLSKLQRGCVHITLPGLPPFRIRGAAPGPTADIRFRRPGAVLRRLFWRGDLGFAEGYMAGEWDSDDPAKLLELFALNLDAYAEADARHSLARGLARFRHHLNRNSRRGSRRNIAAHYDLGNDFYAQWLDASMTYSAARFDLGGSLVEAQERKYQRMLDLIDAKPGEHILEIGCGWGGFAEYAARRGIRVTGVTLSQEQHYFARRRLASQGLSDLAEIELCDYRDFDRTVDHIVSIEMFEAVGREYWNGYFETLMRCLRPGGRVALLRRGSAGVATLGRSRTAGGARAPGAWRCWSLPWVFCRQPFWGRATSSVSWPGRRRAGDRYLCCVDAAGAGALIRDGAPVSSITADDFAQRYLQIWVRSEGSAQAPEWNFGRC